MGEAEFGEKVKVYPVKFGKVEPPKATASPGSESTGSFLMDVPLTVVVELGRARKLLKEVLSFRPGAVIELEKLTGEPLDILVNGKLVARGEVVVLDENFAVRITEIVGVGSNGAAESGDKA
ncbi:MAG: flagellar motor switch protein FliN [Bacillota bacterium]